MDQGYFPVTVSVHTKIFFLPWCVCIHTYIHKILLDMMKSRGERTFYTETHLKQFKLQCERLNVSVESSKPAANVKSWSELIEHI